MPIGREARGHRGTGNQHIQYTTGVGSGGGAGRHGPCLQHAKHRLVGAAVQRAVQRPHGARHHCRGRWQGMATSLVRPMQARWKQDVQLR